MHKKFVWTNKETCSPGIEKFRRKPKQELIRTEFYEKNSFHNCWICTKHVSENIKRGDKAIDLAQDHDHLTGMIRGQLCNQCNIGLGCFKDNIEVLSNAIKYLKQFKKTKE